MKKCFLLVMLFCISGYTLYAQKTARPFTCGFYPRDTTQFNNIYQHTLQYIEVKKGERVASVGAQNGQVEIQLSLLMDSIYFTLQDIDSNCLNEVEVGKVKTYYEKLLGKKISNTFNIVLGTETKTNLQPNYYNRVLLINVYHELSDQKRIVEDIRQSLKSSGRLVIMEKMGKRKNKKRKDCHHIMPFEPDFLANISSCGFVLLSKTVANKNGLSFYVFEKAA